MPSNAASDQDLLDRMLHGEEEAFDELYQRHSDTIYRFAYRMLGSPELAEDVAHDCFLALIRNPKRFDASRGSLRSYLFIAVRNLVYKRLRRRVFEFPVEDKDLAVPTRGESEPLPRLLDQELSFEVRKSIRKMPPLQREVLVLFEYEELSLAEIAAITASDLSAVKSRLHRAREWLRQEMAPYMNGGSRKQRVQPNHD